MVTGSQRDTIEGLTLPWTCQPCAWAVGAGVTVQKGLLHSHWLMGKPDIQQEKTQQSPSTICAMQGQA